MATPTLSDTANERARIPDPTPTCAWEGVETALSAYGPAVRGVLEHIERDLIHAAICAASESMDRMPSAIRSDLQHAVLRTLHDNHFATRAVGALTQAPPEAMDAGVAAQVLMTVATREAGDRLAMLSELLVLYTRNRDQACRIAELEAEVASLRADAAGVFPAVDLSGVPRKQ